MIILTVVRTTYQAFGRMSFDWDRSDVSLMITLE